jgi:SAM-dependent methyltransferase
MLLRQVERSLCLMLVVGSMAGCSSRTRPAISDADDHAMPQGAAFRPVAMMRSQSSAQQPPTPGARPTTPPYTGDLSIFEDPARDKKLQIDRVMNLLGISKRSTVADIGAGGGWFTVRAARKVGIGGMVFAEEINPAAVQSIQQRVAKEGLNNVRTILGTPDDPKLPPDSIDAVLMLKMYHEIAHPIPLMQRLKVALHPSAKVGIIDRNGDGSGTDDGVPSNTVIHEMAEAGFVLVKTYDFTKADGEDYFLVFRPR